MSILLPITIGASTFSKQHKAFRVLFFFFIFSAFIEAGAEFLAYYYGNNMPLFHVFSLIECVIYALVFHFWFKDHKWIQKAILVLGVSVILPSVFDIFFFEGIKKLPTITKMYECTILVMFSLAYFYFFFKQDTESIVWKQPMFWFSVAILIYFSLNLFLFLLINYFQMKDVEVAVSGILMHDLINLLTNVLFAISFRCLKLQIK